MEQTKGRAGIGRIIAFVINLILIGLAVWIFFNRQFVFDQILLFGYQPSSAVSTLASETTMTDLSKRYFYASHPTIDDRTTFNDHCKNTDEQTIVLGCYAQRQIHVFDVNDPRLPGVKEVTSAHEMLHAAYERLSDQEKDQVNGWIDQQLKDLNDDRIKKLIDSYNRTEPGQLHNEMHSILGTEVRQLNPDLENYYKRYFADREKIVNYSEGYEAVFSNLRAKQQTLVTELNDMATSINQQTAALNAQVESLNSDINTFNHKVEGGGFNSTVEFNAARAALLDRQQQLQNAKAAIEAQIAVYNQEKAQLEEINLEAQSLNNSINSKPATVPSV